MDLGSFLTPFFFDHLFLSNPFLDQKYFGSKFFLETKIEKLQEMKIMNIFFLTQYFLTKLYFVPNNFYLFVPNFFWIQYFYTKCFFQTKSLPKVKPRPDFELDSGIGSSYFVLIIKEAEILYDSHVWMSICLGMSHKKY